MSFSAFHVGPEAWVAGRLAIATKAFIFRQTAEDMAYHDLKQFALTEARRYLAEHAADDSTSGTERARLIFTYVHAFVIGALDELSHSTLL